MNLLFKKTIIAGLAKALAALSGFALTLSVTRALGAEEAGYFMLSLAIVTILAQFFRLGLDNIILRYVGASAFEINAQSIVNQSIKWVLQYSLIGTVFLYFSSPILSQYIFSKPNLDPILAAFSICIPFVSLYTLLGFAFQGLHKVVLATVFQNLGVSLLFIITIVGIYFVDVDSTLSPNDLVLIYVISSILLCVLAFIIWFKPPQVNFSFRVTLNDVNEIRTKRNQLWLASIMSLFIQWAGIFFAGIYAEPSEIAYLSAAQRSAMLISFALMVVNMVVAPQYSALWSKGDVKGMRQLSNLSTKYMLLFISPLICVLLFYSDFLMSLFGDGFEEASVLFSILVVGQFINVATGSVGYLLNMSGHEKDIKNLTVLVGSLTLILTFLLTKYFSVFGAALATTIGLSFQNILALLIVKKRLGFWTFLP